MKVPAVAGFQPREGPSRGLLCDYEPLCGPSFEALMTGEVTSQQSPRYTGTSDEVLSAEFPNLDIDTVMNRYIIFGEGTYYSTLII